jgi:phosphoglycolate phosphatase
MWTLLFDIDGTLIHTRGAGIGAIERTMSKLFSVRQLPPVPVQGRTDFGIISDLFRSLDIDLETHLGAFKELYWQYLPESLNERPGVVLPGVNDLLEQLSVRQDCALGIVTGNTSRSAEIKLKHFGLADYFSFGGYGDVHADRNDVARQAKRSAQSSLGDKFDAARMWVVGDTVHDVRCARAIDSKVIAVETGGVERAELISAGPDLLVETLVDSQAFFDLLCVS